jgi:hypothetical protein
LELEELFLLLVLHQLFQQLHQQEVVLVDLGIQVLLEDQVVQEEE